ATPPANDACGSALVITDGTYFGDTTLASNDGAACGMSDTTNDVWYQYTAAADGVLRVNTCGSSYDTVLSIHSGCPGTAANQFACNDDSCGTSSSVAIPASNGTTYWIRVAGWDGATGSFQLNVTLGQPNSGGADVVLGELGVLEQFGRAGDLIGCGLDSPTCNGGGAPLDWMANPDPRHPFMAGNMYRLMAGRFEQIGQSWLKHATGAGQSDACGLGCSPYPDASHLGIGCSDTYSAGENADQPGLGP